jgi:hypothetical protein
LVTLAVFKKSDELMRSERKQKSRKLRAKYIIRQSEKDNLFLLNS